LQFIEDCYFNRRVPYEGSLDDGRYWDTILAVMGLLESGESPQKVSATMEYLIKKAVQPNGGIPYGLEFEYAPDIDDTSLLLLLYGKMKKAGIASTVTYEDEITRSYNWIKSNQNSDGGFPAFDRDKNDNQYKIIKYIFQLSRIDKSA
jgi:squalene-hopene/tetraprenyl-beta-curcumene cyclase